MNNRPSVSSRPSKGYLVILTSTILWSSAAIFIVHLKNHFHLEALHLTFWRNLFVFLQLLPVLLWIYRARLWKIGRQNARFFLLYGAVLASFNLLFTYSAYANGAAVSTVLTYSSAAITSLVGWKLWGESLGKVKIIAIFLCLSGCVLVSGAADLSLWTQNPVGILTGLLSGVAFAAYSLLGKEASHRGINPWLTLFYTFGIGTLFLLGANLLTAPLPALWPELSPEGWGTLFLLSLVATIGGYGLYNVSLDLLPASVANLIVSTEPVFTALQAYILFGELMNLPQISGSALLLGGVVLLRLTLDRAPQAETASAS